MSVTRRQAALGLALAATGALAAPSSGLAKPHPTTVVKSARNAHLNQQIVVDSHAMSLYRLKPETTRHLLCKSTLCLGIWKPLTVRSSSTSAIKAGSGVTGTLGLLRRARNSYQVTLRGYPLYTYVGDGRRSDANGQNIHSFGGTWLALPASTHVPAPKPTPAPPTSMYPY
jgi:predicted lipoprotein with Yx(FWY)xxD motif